jgi:hypothetical protein
MEPKSEKKIRFLYFLLALLIDIESFLWDIAEILIKPLALLRRWVAYRLSLLTNFNK